MRGNPIIASVVSRSLYQVRGRPESPADQSDEARDERIERMREVIQERAVREAPRVTRKLDAAIRRLRDLRSWYRDLPDEMKNPDQRRKVTMASNEVNALRTELRQVEEIAGLREAERRTLPSCVYEVDGGRFQASVKVRCNGSSIKVSGRIHEDPIDAQAEVAALRSRARREYIRRTEGAA